MVFHTRSLTSIFLVFAATFAFPFNDVQARTLQGDEHIDRLPRHRRTAGHWFDEFQNVLATMQNTYCNGTDWATTIQWIGAFLNSQLAASDRSFANALIDDNVYVPDSNTTAATVRKEILQYFSDIEEYYKEEDTIQIFDAAYDDAQWVVLEWLEALKFIQQYDACNECDLSQMDQAGFAHRAHVFYNIVQDKFNTSTCGGGLT